MDFRRYIWAWMWAAAGVVHAVLYLASGLADDEKWIAALVCWALVRIELIEKKMEDGETGLGDAGETR